MAGAVPKRVRGGLSALVVCLPALLAAAAVAAAPVRGAFYRGALIGSRSAVRVSFHVNGAGTSVSSIFISALPLYCPGKPPPTARISFSGAPIGAHGTFSASGTDKIHAGPLKGSVIAKLKLTGTFAANRGEHGELTTTLTGGSAARCSGHASYRTKAS